MTCNDALKTAGLFSPIFYYIFNKKNLQFAKYLMVYTLMRIISIFLWIKTFNTYYFTIKLVRTRIHLYQSHMPVWHRNGSKERTLDFAYECIYTHMRTPNLCPLHTFVYQYVVDLRCFACMINLIIVLLVY